MPVWNSTAFNTWRRQYSRSRNSAGVNRAARHARDDSASRLTRLYTLGEAREFLSGAFHLGGMEAV